MKLGASAVLAAAMLTATMLLLLPQATVTTHLASTAHPVKELRYVVVGDAEFVREVLTILNDPRSWGYAQPTGDNRGHIDFYIWLADPAEALSRCGPAAGPSEYEKHHVSCFFGNAVVINSDRWYNGRDVPRISAPEWRRLIVNHEVGHQLGLPHGDVCSVMNPKVCPGEWPVWPDARLRTMAEHALNDAPA